MIQSKISKQISKQILRKKYISLRNTYTKQQITDASNKIFIKFINKYDKILTSNNKINKFIHIFLPIENKNEINTHLLVNMIMNNSKYKNVFFIIPKMTKYNKEKELEHYYYNPNFTKLEINNYGVLEPIKGEQKYIINDMLNFVIVPLLCWNKEGHRIGYGGGYYDKFLNQCNIKTLKIGVCLFENELEQWNINKYDIKLDDVIIPY